MIWGIFLGLMGATVQSGSYLFSKQFVANKGTPLQLLTGAHIIMSVWALLTLVILCPWITLPAIGTWIFPLLATTLTYLAGQFFFFKTLKYADASRISPLLILKIVTVTFFLAFWRGEHYSMMQWSAVGLCILSALFSGGTGGVLPRKAILFLLLTCLCWGVSDISVKALIDVLSGGEKQLLSAFMATGLSYLFLGLLAILLFRWVPGFRFPGKRALEFYHNGVPTVLGRHVRRSIPFGGCWYLSILCLFGCFGLLGPVFANIIQSTRGMISILMGAFLSRNGGSGIETQVSRRVLICRILAALMMIGAVALFMIG